MRSGLASGPDRTEREHCQRDRYKVANTEVLHGGPGQKCPQHVELTVREVDHARRTQQHRPADRDQGVAGAQHQTIHDLLDEVHIVRLPR